MNPEKIIIIIIIIIIIVVVVVVVVDCLLQANEANKKVWSMTYEVAHFRSGWPRRWVQTSKKKIIPSLECSFNT